MKRFDFNNQLYDLEDLFQKMIEEVEDYAILFLSIDGTIENWNKGAEKIKGYKAEEIIGKNFRIFYSKEDRERKLPEQLLSISINKGKAAHEGWRVRKDGSMFWGSVVITALHGENREVIGFSKVTRDLTERKFAEDKLRNYTSQLEHKNQELEQFAYVASHDLKEPLRKIITFGDLLLNHIDKDEKSIDYVSRMQNASRRMMILIDNLLSLSRVNKENFVFELTDLNTIITEIIHDLEEIINKKKASIKVDPLPKIISNPSQMHQLFQNLITNALKFNDRENPEVRIISEIITINSYPNHQKFCRIYIKDNGIGFEEQYSHKIFHIFHRLHGRSEYEGTGIGLSVCKKIVEVHNGTISAVSKPGEGSTFIVTLPIEAIGIERLEL